MAFNRKLWVSLFCTTITLHLYGDSEKPYVPYQGKFVLLANTSEESPDKIAKEESLQIDIAPPAKTAIEEKEKRTHHVFLEGKAAYFSPINKRVKNIFGKGMGMYGFELTFPTWRFIYGWAGGSYLTKVGHSLGEHNRTIATVVPLALGVKFIYSINIVDMYAGVGALGSYFHSVDRSPYVTRSTSRWSAGGTAKLGLFIRPTEKFYIDFFGDYSYMKFNFHGGRKTVRHDVDFSGWSVGGGLGWPF